ncbi:GNAT family N-acetyltransferase [Pseudoprimorskyibacter insulae]|uniref:Putative N-acetyltransferase YsnE n=1 Tax=Pseudoprimorskyibacter insulae TaxID=1695997 RepID=A0A2R8AUG1_9RHOB|nr:GNAT family N-acetyltransferase [Pseudoprimorskyibacter insulae]SPF79681.1 putative N-acetyltransferase YsnE [Pseudoprimorskyibacter insulae]
MITIRAASPKEPEALALLAASHALMQSLYSPEECHYLDVDQLCVPSITLFLAEEDGVTLGCGAIARKDGYAELKSMFTTPEARGKGVASLIVDQIEATARGESIPVLRLETGHVLHAAHRLYERHGFTLCGPFGSYKAVPASIFYEKSLG